MRQRKCRFTHLPFDLQVLIGDFAELADGETAARKLSSHTFRIRQIPLRDFRL